MKNLNIVFNELKQYKSEAKVYEELGNFKETKKYLKKAAEAAFDLFSNTEGETKVQYGQLLDKILTKAESIPDEADIVDKSLILTKNENNRYFTDNITIPSVTLDDVAGLDDVKSAIERRIIKPRNHPDVYKMLKIKPGGGILMYGAPGTGKTMIAKAIANKVGVVFCSISCSEILSKWMGDAEKEVVTLFREARENEMAVIFFDEFDSLGANRTDTTHEQVNRVVATLLSQMDGFTSTCGSDTLIFIAATNRPWAIDSAFLRPGRFSEQIYIPLPNTEARESIIYSAFSDVPIAEDVDFDNIIKLTDGFNGSDVVEFCDRSKILAADRCISKYNGNLAGLMVMGEDILKASSCVFSSVRRDDLEKLEDFKKKYYKFQINSETSVEF